MADLSTCDAVELELRAEEVLAELDELMKEIGPKFEKMARMQLELQMIESELEKRKDG